MWRARVPVRRQSWSEMFVPLLLRFRFHSPCTLSRTWIFIRLNEHSHPFESRNGDGKKRATVNATKNEVETIYEIVLGRHLDMFSIKLRISLDRELMRRNLTVAWENPSHAPRHRLHKHRRKAHSHGVVWWSIISRLMARFISLNTFPSLFFFRSLKEGANWMKQQKKNMWSFVRKNEE